MVTNGDKIRLGRLEGKLDTLVSSLETLHQKREDFEVHRRDLETRLHRVEDLLNTVINKGHVLEKRLAYWAGAIALAGLISSLFLPVLLKCWR